MIEYLLFGFLLAILFAGVVMFGPTLAALTIAYFIRNPAVRIICILFVGYWTCALIYEWPPFYNCRCEPDPCAWCGGGSPG